MPRTTGQKPFAPSKEQCREVQMLAGFGLTQQQICLLVVNPKTHKPITLKTLLKYFRAELDAGMLRADVAVVQSLYFMACGRPAEYYPPGHPSAGKLMREELAPTPSAAIFWTKARPNLRWTERVEFTGNIDSTVEVTSARQSLAKKLDTLSDNIQGRITGLAVAAGASRISTPTE